ncbi:uncharacterized protein BDV14DRAFT_201458 [Aspergillus stella-maris]|uniref:uncharacterized protein n=1 Tax=Aspergillus stella-maris TaxID=1810926 RepID=UPI003CCD692B
MAHTNHLSQNIWEGAVDGITINWHPNAKKRLEEHAEDLDAEAEALKHATEHFAHACAKRLGKTSLKIMLVSLVHHTAQRRGPSGQLSSSIGLSPGGHTAHIYTNLTKGMAMADMQVVGEGVWKRNKIIYELSWGEYPSPGAASDASNPAASDAAKPAAG